MTPPPAAGTTPDAFCDLHDKLELVNAPLGIAFLVGSMMLSTLLSTEFMPATDRGRSVISVEQEPDAANRVFIPAVLQGR